jgi:hypothetical protein
VKYVEKEDLKPELHRYSKRKLLFGADSLKQKSVFCLRQVGNELAIPGTILECLMGH